MRKKIIALACGLLGTCKIFAAMPLESGASAQAGAADFFSELPVVLSVTRLPQAMKDVPGFVTVITADDIRYSGARDLAELLRTVPGFNVSYSDAGAPGAAYHGLAEDFPKGLQVLINGRSQYSPIFQSGVAWNLIDVPLTEIARIEVLRGSNSPAYGSNAFMGVVNVITKHSAETRGVAVSANEGSGALRDRYARFGFGNEGWSGRLSAEQTEDDGLETFYDSRHTRRFNLQIDADPSAANTLRFSAGLLQLDYQRGSPTNLKNPNRDVKTESSFGQADWTHRWDDANTTELSYHHIHQKNADQFELVIPRTNLLFVTDYSENGQSHRDEVSAQHAVQLSELSLLGGVSYRSDVVSHDRYFGVGRELRQWVSRAFGQAEWRPSPYATVNLGATYEDDSISSDALLPRFALNFHPAPNHTFKYVIGKSRRTPTLYESRGDERLYQKVDDPAPLPAPVGTLMMVDKSSSGTVKPTEVVTKEFGYFGDLRSLDLTLDARIFREDTTDWIRPAQNFFNSPLPGPIPPFGSPPNYPPGSANCPLYDHNFEYNPCGLYEDFYNQLRATVRGWETQIVWRPARTTAAGFGFAHVKIDVDWTSAIFPLDPDTVKYIEESAPLHSTSLWGRHRLFERVTVSAGYYRVGNMRWNRNTQAGEFHRFDWRIGYDFKLGPAKAELAWTVRNDGSNHTENRGYNRQGQPLAKPETVVTQHFTTLRVEF